jgi:hypothetical protein
MSNRFYIGARALLLTLAAGLATGCSVNREPARLVVSGPAAQVEQYLARQTVSRPQLKAVLSPPDGQGRVEATLVLPRHFYAPEVVDLANSATDARLSWSYSEGRSSLALRLG